MLIFVDYGIHFITLQNLYASIFDACVNQYMTASYIGMLRQSGMFTWCTGLEAKVNESI